MPLLIEKRNCIICFKTTRIVIANSVGHITAVYAMFEKGGGSFTHVIKASEPIVNVLLALIINRTPPKFLTFISLLPIAYGVAYASTLGHLSFDTIYEELTTNVAM